MRMGAVIGIAYGLRIAPLLAHSSTQTRSTFAAIRLAIRLANITAQKSSTPASRRSL